jgi:hypothetical protein
MQVCKLVNLLFVNASVFIHPKLHDRRRKVVPGCLVYADTCMQSIHDSRWLLRLLSPHSSIAPFHRYA